MATTPLDEKPSLAELTAQVNVGIKWRQLGIQLKLGGKVLDNIDRTYGDIPDKMSAMYQSWLEKKVYATRRAVLKALTIIEEFSLAAEYEKNQLQQAPKEDSIPKEEEEDYSRPRSPISGTSKNIRSQGRTCDNCTAPKPNAAGHCKDCNQFLCQECIDMHKKWARFADHQITLNEWHDEPLKYFCETCEEVINRDCAMLTHKDHKYKSISKSYREHRKKLEMSLNPVKEKVDAIKNFLTALTEREDEINNQEEAVREEIRMMVEEFRHSEGQLIKEVETVKNGKLQVLSKQKRSAETSLSNLKDCEDYVEQSLKMGSPQQVLMAKKQMMERMSQVTQQINVEEFNPIEKADVQLIKDSEAVHHIGDIVYTSLQQCKVKEIDRVENLPKEKKVSFPLSLELPDSSLLTVPVSSLSCSLVPVGKGQPITTTVTTTTQPGVYRIRCSPSTSGRHQVNVQVHDIQLESTSLVIPFNPHLDTITPVYTIGELNRPSRVDVSDDGHVIVTEWRGHCVTVLDSKGKKVKSFGGEGRSGRSNVKFSHPRGVAITPDNFILVADEHKIQKITKDGECIASVGGQGSGPLQFNTPNGIAISPITGLIYVADRYNHRIQVLTPDLTFSHSFGNRGSAEGQFIQPWDIAIDSQGLLYVTDWCNHRIQKFTSEGKFVAQFGTKGSDPKQLFSPAGITVDTTDLVYVTEYGNNRVSIFTSEGQFVNIYGEEGTNEDQFNSPVGITVDKGVLYVCDQFNNRLVVYTFQYQ